MFTSTDCQKRLKNISNHGNQAIVNFMVLPSEHVDVLCFFAEIVTECIDVLNFPCMLCSRSAK